MIANKEYKKLYRKYIRKQADKKRKITLWLNRRSERHIQIIAAMFFIGFVLIVYFGFKTLATWGQITQIFIGLAVLFSFMPAKWLPFIYRIRKELKVLLGICALAPFLTGIILMINFYITSDETIYTIKITDYQTFYSDRIVEVVLEDKELNKHFEIRKFSIDKYDFEPDSAVFDIRKGIFGLDAVHNSWLLPKK